MQLVLSQQQLQAMEVDLVRGLCKALGKAASGDQSVLVSRLCGQSTGQEAQSLGLSTGSKRPRGGADDQARRKSPRR